jgi:pimeloyl-ACP methyl ester carboxylesterase
MTRRQLLILHGVNGCKTEVQPWGEALSERFDVTLMNLAGHGGREIPSELTMARYADDLLLQMDRLQLRNPVILGYSFGGVVALYLAVHHPQRVSAIVTVATRWIYSPSAVRHAMHLLQVSRLSSLPHRREHLTRIHYPSNWKTLAQRLCAMYASFEHQPPVTREELLTIAHPCLVLSGSADPITSADETIALHRSLPGSEIAMYSGQAHPPEVVPVRALARAVTAWADRHLVEAGGPQ